MIHPIRTAPPRLGRATTPLLATLVIVLLVGVIAGQAVSQSRGNARPTRVAVVELPRVVDGLEERGSLMAEIQSMADDFDAQAQDWRERLEAVDAELQAVAPSEAGPLDDATRQRVEEIADRRLRMRTEFVEWRAFAQSLLDQETSFRLRRLYQSVKGEIASMAQVEGYDLVLVDDSRGELAEPNPQSRVDAETQILQQIRNRRVLYAGDVIDVTDALIERMNNAFRAGRGQTP